MIRRAKIKEIPKILSLTRACALHMSENGIEQWNEHYPSAEVFAKDIDRGELYVFVQSTEIIGTIVITSLMDKEYEAVKWLTPNKNNVYIHRLAIHPDFQGRGHAQQLMAFAEDAARKKHYNSIRLDTFSQNSRNQKFYEVRGYSKLEDVYFPMQSEFPFHCYELVL